MSGVQLAASQYVAYDEVGEVVASRSVRAHTLSEVSESGPGICVVLRTGEELGNTDGIGVSLTITDAQLDELGYVKAEPIAEQVSQIVDLLQGMPDEPFMDMEFEDYEGREVLPKDYAFCAIHRGMVDPDEMIGKDWFKHDAQNLEVFCTVFNKWVPLFAGKTGQDHEDPHGSSFPCVDRRAVKTVEA